MGASYISAEAMSNLSGRPCQFQAETTPSRRHVRMGYRGTRLLDSAFYDGNDSAPHEAGQCHGEIYVSRKLAAAGAIHPRAHGTEGVRQLLFVQLDVTLVF